MKTYIIRKNRKKKQRENVKIKDFEFEIIYVKTPKRARKLIKKEEIDFFVSNDFENLCEKPKSLMSFYPEKTIEKICVRHGIDLYEKPIGALVTDLNEENRKILEKVALSVRFMNIYSMLSPKNFEFLLDTGLSPHIKNFSEPQEEITVFLGNEFLIKEAKSGKTYYDITLTFEDEFFKAGILEINSILANVLEENEDIISNVKIRELMSK